MRSITVLLAAVAVAICLGPVSASAKPLAPASGYGFAEGSAMLSLSPADLNRELDAVSKTSASWLRVEVNWSRIEPTAGVFDWSATDRVINAARAHGLRVLANIAYTPAWAGAPQWTSPPANPNRFGQFASTVASRYQDRVQHYEVWNEPNLQLFFNTSDKPRRFVDLLKAAYPAIKKVQPSATVVAGGLSPADGPDSPVTFLDAVYAAGGGGYFDAVAMHPYVFPQGLAVDPAHGWRSVGAMHAVMTRHGQSWKQVWLTELGAPTNYVQLGSVYPQLGGVSPREQANQIRDVLAAAARTPYVGPAFIYSIRDLGGSDVGSMLNRENHFGALLTYDWRSKPGAAVLAR